MNEGARMQSNPNRLIRRGLAPFGSRVHDGWMALGYSGAGARVSPSEFR